MNIVLELVKVLFAFVLVMGIVPLLIWLERKISAWIQGRVGPNRVGPFGLLQPLADVVKLLFKEDIVPTNADKGMYFFAPLLAMVAPVILFAFIPFGPDIVLADYTFKLQVCDFGVSILFFMAVLSTAVFAVAFGGWASNNKYSLLGGIRAASQLVSYELILSGSFLYILLKWNTLSFRELIEKQAAYGWTIVSDFPFSLLFFILFFIAALAENKRAPFDLPEAEPELVGGYHTEYSSMKFAMFFMGEYIAITVMCFCMSVMFLGGYHFPGVVDVSGNFLNALLGLAVILAKVFILIFIYMWIRWTLPRFRYDILMRLSWHYLLPLTVILILVKALI
ncbi:MAG: NADH-quinone oxidoreductase subunit H [Planctomycetes bacterium]|nr:NADH-quinone oxidoreductase subunit H [Planctomycetota bacterium]